MCSRASSLISTANICLNWAEDLRVILHVQSEYEHLSKRDAVPEIQPFCRDFEPREYTQKLSIFRCSALTTTSNQHGKCDVEHIQRRNGDPTTSKLRPHAASDRASPRHLRVRHPLRSALHDLDQNDILLHVQRQKYGISYGAPADHPCFDPSSKPCSLLRVSRQVRSEHMPAFYDRLHCFINCDTRYWDDLWGGELNQDGPGLWQSWPHLGRLSIRAYAVEPGLYEHQEERSIKQIRALIALIDKDCRQLKSVEIVVIFPELVEPDRTRDLLEALNAFEGSAYISARAEHASAQEGRSESVSSDWKLIMGGVSRYDLRPHPFDLLSRS